MNTNYMYFWRIPIKNKKFYGHFYNNHNNSLDESRYPFICVMKHITWAQEVGLWDDNGRRNAVLFHKFVISPQTLVDFYHNSFP